MSFLFLLKFGQYIQIKKKTLILDIITLQPEIAFEQPTLF